MEQEGQLEMVLETLDPAEAAIVGSLLEGSGIPFLIRGEDRFDAFRGAFRGTVFSRKGRPICFLVNRLHADEARQLLATEMPLPEPDDDAAKI